MEIEDAINLVDSVIQILIEIKKDLPTDKRDLVIKKINVALDLRFELMQKL